MKKIKHTRLLKKLGMLAVAIAPIAIIANGDGDSVTSATALQVTNLRAANVSTQPKKARDVNYNAKPTAGDVSVPEHPGFVFRFLSASRVDSDGSSDVVFTVQSTNPNVRITIWLDFEVFGFQTKAVFDANNAIDALRVANITAPTKKSGAMVAYNTQPDDTHIDKPVKSDFAFTFVSATAVASGGTSDVTYSVTKEGVTGAKTRNLLFRGVTGFQTKAGYDANAEIDALRVADITAPTKKSGVMVAYNTQPQTADINKPVKSDFSFTFVSATAVASDGTSDVTYSVTKEGVVGAKTRNLLFRGVTGF